MLPGGFAPYPPLPVCRTNRRQGFLYLVVLLAGSTNTPHKYPYRCNIRTTWPRHLSWGADTAHCLTQCRNHLQLALGRRSYVGISSQSSKIFSQYSVAYIIAIHMVSKVIQGILKKSRFIVYLWSLSTAASTISLWLATIFVNWVIWILNTCGNMPHNFCHILYFARTIYGHGILNRMWCQLTTDIVRFFSIFLKSQLHENKSVILGLIYVPEL